MFGNLVAHNTAFYFVAKNMETFFVKEALTMRDNERKFSNVILLNWL